MSFPRRVTVSEVLSARYEPGRRPLSWDERIAGIEEVKTEDGEVLKLYSNGGQSTPAPGWELLLMKERDDSADNALQWTLYGIKRQVN